MDEDTLQKLWEITIPGVGDLGALDPDRSYRPQPPAGAEPIDEGSSAGPLILPLFTVARGDPAASAAGALSEVAEPGQFTTLVEAHPLGSSDPGSSPTPGGPAAVVRDGAGRSWFARSAPGAEQGGFLYQLREVVGKGGMGVVYRAHQASLQRDVAVKKILAERAAPELQKRFLAEALVTGRLDHPNVVPVYDLGVTPEGETVLAMKLVEGTSWKRLLHPRTPDEQERARKHDLTWHLGVLRSVGNAVAFAHSRGLVHLDLKPENVMVGEFGEVLVMDWGLAVEVTPEPVPGSPIPHRSQLRAPCGTPAYMPPELAEGRGDDVGPWSDVFLLGAILLELITGRPPNRGGTFRETVMMAVRCPPRDIPLDVPPDLAAICRKALERDPRDRYQTVPALQEALDQHLAHRESLQVSQRAGARLAACQRAAGKLLQRIHGPIPAPPGEVERERSRLYGEYAEAVAGFAQARLLWAGNEEATRGELLARLSFAEAALLQQDLGLAEAQLAQTDPDSRTGQTLRQRVDEARQAQRRAAFQARTLRLGLAGALLVLVTGLSLGIVAVRRERDRANDAAAEAARQRDEAQNQRGAAERERARAEQRQAESLVQQGDLLGRAGRWPEARARLEQARELLHRQGLPLLPVQLGEWEADHSAPAPLFRLPQAGAVTAVTFLPGARPQLLAADRTGEVRLWDATQGLVRARWQAGAAQRALLVLPDRRAAVGAGEDGALRLWELPSGRELRVLRGHEGPVTCLACTQDGATIVSGGEDGLLRAWSVAEGAELSREKGHQGAVSGLIVIQTRFGPLGYSCGTDGKLLQWAINPLRVRDRLRREGAPLLAMAYGYHELPGEDRDDPGDLIALATADHELELWGLDVTGDRRSQADWRERARLRPHRAPVSALAFTSQGRYLLSAGQDGRVVATDLEGDLSLASPAPPMSAVARSVAGQAPFACLSCLDQGGLVAAGGEEGAVSVWDLGLGERLVTGGESGRELRVLPLRAPWLGEKEEAVQAVSAALAPDGALAVAGTVQGPLLLWHLGSGQLLAQLIGHRAPARALLFLDARRLLSAAEDGRVLTHDLGGAQPDLSISTVEVGVSGQPALAPRGDALAMVVAGRGVLLFQLPGGQLQRELPIPDARVAAWSPRGGLLLVGRAGGEVSLFEAGSGREVRQLKPAHAAPISALAFSGDGTRSLSASEDGLVRGWETAQGWRLHDLRGHASAVRRAGFTPEGGLAWTAGTDGVWRLWSVERGSELHAFAGPAEGLQDLAVDPQLRLALGASRDGRVLCWQLDRPQRRRALEPALRQALSEARERSAPGLEPPAATLLADWLAFSGAHRLALEAAARGGALAPAARLAGAWALERPAAALRALDEVARSGSEPAHVLALCRARLEQLHAARGDLLGRLDGIPRGVRCSPDGARLAAVCNQGELQVWELSSGRLLMTQQVGVEPGGVVWTPDGARLVTGNRAGQVRCYDAATGELLLALQALAQERVEQVVGLPDDAAGVGQVLVRGDGGSLGRLALQEGAALVPLQVPGAERIRRVAVSRDGRRALFAAEKRLLLWDLEANEALREWELERSADAVLFLPDGRLAAACGHQLLIGPLEGDEPPRVVDQASRQIYAVGCAEDGGALAAVDDDGRVAVFDLPAATLRWEGSLRAILLGVAVTPDGRRVITAERDGTLRCWER